MSITSIILTITLLVAYTQAGVIGYGGYNGHSGSESESHDFSEGLSQSESAHYESLGSLGDHLDESHFPSDFDESQKGDEYAEGSEHIEIGEPYHHEHHSELHHHFEHEPLHHDHHSLLHDFDTKPVPGINHGKGALSYSTTYEYQDPKP